MIDEIGIEREYFLVDKKGQIIEPKLFGFPYDEFGFLVEIRTRPHISTKMLMDELMKLIEVHSAQAKALDFELKLLNAMKLKSSFLKYLSEKYSYSHLKDLTANVYPKVAVTHATGLDTKKGYGTAGCHIHFSRKTLDGRQRVQLPIIKIVYAFDARFNREIALANRMAGEYEIKPHGFEYRSLPATINIFSAVEFGFMLLERDRRGLLI